MLPRHRLIGLNHTANPRTGDGHGDGPGLMTGAAGRVRVDATAGGSSNSDNDLHGPFSKKKETPRPPGDADVPQGVAGIERRV